MQREKQQGERFMSQEKVDRYKEQKKNRKAILAKKKRNVLDQTIIQSRYCYIRNC